MDDRSPNTFVDLGEDTSPSNDYLSDLPTPSDCINFLEFHVDPSLITSLR